MTTGQATGGAYNGVGYEDVSSARRYGSISPSTFSIDGTQVTIKSVRQYVRGRDNANRFEFEISPRNRSGDFRLVVFGASYTNEYVLNLSGFGIPQFDRPAGHAAWSSGQTLDLYLYEGAVEVGRAVVRQHPRGLGHRHDPHDPEPDSGRVSTEASPSLGRADIHRREP